MKRRSYSPDDCLARVGPSRFSQLLIHDNIPHHIRIKKIQDFVSCLLAVVMALKEDERFPEQFGVREMCGLLDLDDVKLTSGLFIHD